MKLKNLIALGILGVLTLGGNLINISHTFNNAVAQTNTIEYKFPDATNSWNVSVTDAGNDYYRMDNGDYVEISLLDSGYVFGSDIIIDAKLGVYGNGSTGDNTFKASLRNKETDIISSEATNIYNITSSTEEYKGEFTLSAKDSSDSIFRFELISKAGKQIRLQSIKLTFDIIKDTSSYGNLESLTYVGTPTVQYIGQEFNPSGLTFTASYENISVELSYSQLTFSPSIISEDTTEVVVTFETVSTTISVSGYVEEAPKEYVLDLDGNQVHSANNSSGSQEIKNEEQFNAAFPQASNVKVLYVGSTKMYASSITSTSTQASKFGSSSVNGNVTFALTNTSEEYITSLSIDAYGWNGGSTTTTISNDGETSKVIDISTYGVYDVDLSTWNEPTQFTLTFDGRCTVYSISIKYDLKQLKDPITSFEINIDNVSLNNEHLTEQIQPTILPETAEQKITWASEDSTIAKVDNNGLITAVSVGSTKIIGTTIGVNSNGEHLTKEISVNVNDETTMFVLTKDTTSWPDAFTNSYSTLSINLYNYKMRRFGLYNDSVLEFNKISGTTTSSIGNVTSYSTNINKITVTLSTPLTTNLVAYGGDTSYGKDLQINPNIEGSVYTYNFSNENYKYFTLINESDSYIEVENIVITLKNDNEQVVSEFINTYLHPEVEHTNTGTGLCITDGWYDSAKEAFNALTLEQRQIFVDDASYTQWFARLSAWAKANGDTFDASNMLVSASNNNTLIIDDQNYLIVILTISVLSISVISLFAISKRKAIRK